MLFRSTLSRVQRHVARPTSAAIRCFSGEVPDELKPFYALGEILFSVQRKDNRHRVPSD